MTTILRSVTVVMVLILCAAYAGAQSRCLSPDEAKAMLAQVNSPQSASFDKKLRNELLKLHEELHSRYLDQLTSTEEDTKLIPNKIPLAA